MAYPMPNKPSAVPVRPSSSMIGGAVPKKAPGHGSWLKRVITIIIVVVIIGGGIYLLMNSLGIDRGWLSGNRYFVNNWQSVFLTNGQVYFGKIVKMNSDYVVMDNIYYLQVVSQPLQQSSGAQNPPSNTNGQDQRLTLIKLGNELHGPRDEIVINRSQILLMEDLKDDGRVVQAINNYLKSGGQ